MKIVALKVALIDEKPKKKIEFSWDVINVCVIFFRVHKRKCWVALSERISAFAAVPLWFKPEALFLSANSNHSARAQMEEGWTEGWKKLWRKFRIL